MRQPWACWMGQSIFRKYRVELMHTPVNTRYSDCTIRGETHVSSGKVCLVGYLGVVPYDLAFRLQQALLSARAKRLISDVLLLLQHRPAFTVGQFRGEEDIIVPREMLTHEGIAVFHTNRGGSVTYHGPGQLIGYPVLNLKEKGLGVRQYIWSLEEVVIMLLHSIGIQGHRVADHRGVWVGDKKICSVGVNVSRDISTHGFALNVSNELHYFRYIRPCGLASEVMTSVSELSGRSAEVETVVSDAIHCFSEVFGLDCKRRDDACLAMLGALSG
jgi:lipoyl(octanoyl) transferase